MDTTAYLIEMREKNMDINKVHLTPSDNDSQKATQNKIIIQNDMLRYISIENILLINVKL